MTANEVVIRTAGLADAAAVAQLKIEWDAADPTPMERAEFVEAMRDWMDRMGDALITVAAAEGGEIVGMANVVLFPRVPNFADRARTTGDLQSVYVRPAHRDRGIGARLLRALTDETDRRGVPRVTVSSSDGAVTAYRRAGFEPSSVLMQRHRPDPPTTYPDPPRPR